VQKNKIPENELAKALNELENGLYNANLGGSLFKKRIGIDGKGKSGGGRTIICFKKLDRAIFIHGFAKNEKENLSKKELDALKGLAKILLRLSVNQLKSAIKNGDLIEVK
jgi:hypothetical protein